MINEMSKTSGCFFYIRTKLDCVMTKIRIDCHWLSAPVKCEADAFVTFVFFLGSHDILIIGKFYKEFAEKL